LLPVSSAQLLIGRISYCQRRRRSHSRQSLNKRSLTQRHCLKKIEKQLRAIFDVFQEGWLVSLKGIWLGKLAGTFEGLYSWMETKGEVSSLMRRA
jgi:hypothetical protein